MQPAVYILARQRNGTLYTGVTRDLPKRIWEHKNDAAEGFSKRYGVHLWLYFELHLDMLSAITREKQIKKWNRAWKIRLIESVNSEWRDLLGWNLVGASYPHMLKSNILVCQYIFVLARRGDYFD